MSDELFTIPPSPSPKLLWLERHGLCTYKDGAAYVCEWDAEMTARGETEDECIVNFCVKYKVRHYCFAP